MGRAIITCFHKYTPFGGEYYEPILDFYLKNMRNYRDEYDKIYLIDSNWNIDLFGKYKVYNLSKSDWNVEVLKVNPNLRYYEAYKEVLPKIKEDLVLFMDNDMVVYRKDVILDTFKLLSSYAPDNPWGEYKPIFDVVSIYATIGEKIYPQLNEKSKFCLHWFATRKELLMKYLDIDWGSHMPHSETLGLLTEAMLKDNIKPYEWEEDYSQIYFDGRTSPPNITKSKDLGYYHIQAGSTPVWLLSARSSKEHNKTYWEYLKNQPKQEYLRQLMWYQYMGGNTAKILLDIGLSHKEWLDYITKFIKFHGLEQS